MPRFLPKTIQNKAKTLKIGPNMTGKCPDMPIMPNFYQNQAKMAIKGLDMPIYAKFLPKTTQNKAKIPENRARNG